MAFVMLENVAFIPDSTTWTSRNKPEHGTLRISSEKIEIVAEKQALTIDQITHIQKFGQWVVIHFQDTDGKPAKVSISYRPDGHRFDIKPVLELFRKHTGFRIFKCRVPYKEFSLTTEVIFELVSDSKGGFNPWPVIHPLTRSARVILTHGQGLQLMSTESDTFPIESMHKFEVYRITEDQIDYIQRSPFTVSDQLKHILTRVGIWALVIAVVLMLIGFSNPASREGDNLWFLPLISVVIGLAFPLFLSLGALLSIRSLKTFKFHLKDGTTRDISIGQKQADEFSELLQTHGYRVISRDEMR